MREGGDGNKFNLMLCVALDGLVPSDIIPFGRITSDVVTKRA